MVSVAESGQEGGFNEVVLLEVVAGYSSRSCKAGDCWGSWGNKGFCSGRGFVFKLVRIVPGNVEGVAKRTVKRSKVGVQVPHVGRIRYVARKDLAQEHV